MIEILHEALRAQADHAIILIFLLEELNQLQNFLEHFSGVLNPPALFDVETLPDSLKFCLQLLTVGGEELRQERDVVSGEQHPEVDQASVRYPGCRLDAEHVLP